MVRLWWLWWPQPARPPPQRWHQAAEHKVNRGCGQPAATHGPPQRQQQLEKVASWWHGDVCDEGVGGGFEVTVVVWGEYGSGGDRGVKMVTGLMCGGCDEVGR
ncbi:hypothetical protein Tco_0638174 [Tanacetum coccineum]